jgi:hypothetical protein
LYFRLTASELEVFAPHKPQSLFEQALLDLLMACGVSVNLDDYFVVVGW